MYKVSNCFFPSCTFVHSFVILCGSIFLPQRDTKVTRRDTKEFLSGHSATGRSTDKDNQLMTFLK